MNLRHPKHSLIHIIARTEKLYGINHAFNNMKTFGAMRRTKDASPNSFQIHTIFDDILTGLIFLTSTVTQNVNLVYSVGHRRVHIYILCNKRHSSRSGADGWSSMLVIGSHLQLTYYVCQVNINSSGKPCNGTILVYITQSQEGAACYPVPCGKSVVSSGSYSHSGTTNCQLVNASSWDKVRPMI